MSAVDCTARLLAWSLLLQTLELWRLRADLQLRYPWSIVGRDQRWLDPLLGQHAWPWLLALQGVVALGLALSALWWLPWLSLALALLQAVRFRGNFNGGSDAMTLVVLLGLALARTPWLRPQIGLGYIAAQLVLSYFLAGVYKLRGADWRDGSALPALLRLPQYRAQLVLPAWLARWSGYAVIAWECAFPLAFLDRRLALGAMALGIGFHAFNAAVLGLNRFLWAWLAAYPALWFWTGV